MVKFSQVRELEEYSKIAGQLGENPFLCMRKLAHKVGLARKTVSIYLESMYTQNILVGPWISLNPHTHYREYVYLVNFADPFCIFQGFKGFPGIVHHAVTIGLWNTVIITDRLLNFSRFTGFESVVYLGIKGHSYTPEVKYTTWDQSWKKVYAQLDQFTPGEPEYTNGKLTSLDWGSDQWKLFHAFRLNMRQKVTPVLKEIDVQYETYTKWKKTLQNHCTAHTEFYPRGYKEYTNYCLLLATEYHQSVTSLFSLFPTTPVIIEMGDCLLVFVKVPSDTYRNMIMMLNDMIRREMVRKVNYTELCDYR